jgi:hypothetical protein
MRRGKVRTTAISVFVLSAVIVGGAIRAEEKQPRATPQPAASDASAASGSVAELLELRRRLGPSPLEGTLLDRPAGEAGDQAEFADALRREFASGASPPSLPLGEPEGGELPVVPAESSADATLISALREAAWRLDEKAHRLERLESYSEADDCRRLARRLRREARRLSAAASLRREVRPR